MGEVDGFAVGWVRFTGTMEVLSSAVLNGGDSRADAVFIMQVGKNYSGSDPEEDAAHVRDVLGLPGNSVGMMTAAEVARVFNLAEGSQGGVTVEAVATAGLSNQVVAGEELDNYPERRVVSDRRAALLAGTINTVVLSPVPLTMEGKVNILLPMVEAKSAALADRGYRETGTTSDAVAVVCPAGEPGVSYTGTGSDIGIAAARAVRRAIGHALEVRDEHPVKEEPFRILRNLGVTVDDMAAMSGSGMSAEAFGPLMERALQVPGVRSLLDLTVFCADRADSMAADGDAGDRELIMIITREVTGVDPDPSEGTVRAVVGAISRYAFDSGE